MKVTILPRQLDNLTEFDTERRDVNYPSCCSVLPPVREVEQSIDFLLANLSAAPIPLPLLSQYMPDKFHAVRSGFLQNQPGQLIQYGITAVFNDYTHACGWR